MVGGAAMLPVSIGGEPGGSAAAPALPAGGGVSGALGVVSGIVMMRAVRAVGGLRGRLARSALALAVSICLRPCRSPATGGDGGCRHRRHALLERGEARLRGLAPRRRAARRSLEVARDPSGSRPRCGARCRPRPAPCWRRAGSGRAARSAGCGREQRSGCQASEREVGERRPRQQAPGEQDRL